MCGFAGIIQWNPPANKPAISDDTLNTVDQLLAHRGPDGSGRWRDPHNPACVLLHRRLSIVDLAGGAQPMANEDQSVQVVFNGEIYNHRDLRSELKQLGHSFSSDHSDTEVLVHGWEQWNSALPEKLTGMFAFAVWDTRSRTLFLARDRMGQKPLFYQSAENVLYFASTLPALLALGAKAVTSMRSMAGYLAHGYLPPPFTIYENIFQLSPGECLTARQDQLHRQHYWQAAPALPDPQAPADVSAVIDSAVASQMHADVPMACFLSGGIDSTIIAGLMQRHAARIGAGRIKTINIGFAEAVFDETAFAQIAADHIGSQHHTFQVNPGADVMETLQWLMRYTLGQPFADSSILPTYYLANCARMVAPCAISGDGGDELFGGYDRYRALRVITAAPRLSRLLANAAMLVSPQPRTRRFAAATQKNSWPLRYAALTTLFSAADIHTLLPELAEHDVLLAWPTAQDETSDAARSAMLLDQRHYLPGDVLWKVDSASMANALEVRSPFLDHHVIASAAAIPTAELLDYRTGKLALKKSFPDLLPPAISHRTKQGFGLPIGQWFRQQLREPLHDLLTSKASFFQSAQSQKFLKKMMQEHQQFQRDHTHRLFACLMLEVWHRQ